MVGWPSDLRVSAARSPIAKQQQQSLSATARQRPDAHPTLHHDDWEFKFHSSGHVMKSGDVSDEQLASMLQNNINENSRCVYENDDILVQHSVVTFPSGDKEAVLMVSQKKDGLIWRTETGATPLK